MNGTPTTEFDRTVNLFSIARTSQASEALDAVTALGIDFA